MQLGTLAIKLLCRLFGHAWDHRPIRNRPGDRYAYLLKCKRCAQLHPDYTDDEVDLIKVGIWPKGRGPFDDVRARKGG